MTMRDLGWDDGWQSAFDALDARGDHGFLPGRVVGEHRTHYQVKTDFGEFASELTGRFRATAAQRSDLPGVGDYVALRPSAEDGPAMIEAVLPRRTELIRKASSEERPQLLAANVNVFLIVTGLDGDYNLQRLERYVALVQTSGAKAVIVVNKADLSAGQGSQGSNQGANLAATLAEIEGARLGVDVHAISAKSDASALEPYFDGNQTIALIGSSGVGKSTLTNRLLGIDVQLTQAVRAHDSRGRHTTTHRELFVRTGGGMIIDTPGMRGLEVWDEEKAEEPDFSDIEALAADCKFRDCKHTKEPGCAVRRAIDDGRLDVAHLAKFAAPVRSGAPSHAAPRRRR
jgi:ribosome biogenesis GTPase / thiamine phosphate phosphatase